MEKTDLVEALEEEKWIKDMNSITPRDITQVFLDVMDKDTTVEMIEENLIEADMRLRDYRLQRIHELLGVRFPSEFKKEQENIEVAEVKT
jgi:hypothetical protein